MNHRFPSLLRCVCVALAWLAADGAGPSAAAAESNGKARARRTDEFFASTNVPHFKIEVTGTNLTRIRKDPRRYVRATVRVGDEVFADVALHLKGAAGSFRNFDDRPALTLVNDGRLVTFAAPAGGGDWTRSDNQRASPRFGILSVAASDPPLIALASVGPRQYLAVRRDGVLARLDAASGREGWRLATVGLGEIADVQLNFERSHVLLMGKTAWRVFRLADGFAQSGLLAPPETAAARAFRLAAEKQAPPTPGAASTPAAAARAARAASAAAASACRLADALGADGSVLARCGRQTFAWQPRVFSGDLEPHLGHLTCAADVKASAVDTIRRCYVVAQ